MDPCARQLHHPNRLRRRVASPLLRGAAMAGWAFLLLLPACGEGEPVAPSLHDLTLPDPRGPFNLDREVYRLGWRDGYWETTLHYTWQNRTGAEVYIVHCHGGFDLRLERWTGSTWTPAWRPNLLRCLSPPIVIPPGETRGFDLHVAGGLPGSDQRPTFDQRRPDGLYRLVWLSALAELDPAYPQGPLVPEELRVSSPFLLMTR